MNDRNEKCFWIGIFAELAVVVLLAVGVGKSAVSGRHLGMRYFPLFLAFGALFAVFDTLIRFRLGKVGEQSRPFQGGLFNHAKYLRLRRQYHWSGLPVYLIWVAWLAVIGLLFSNLLHSL